MMRVYVAASSREYERARRAMRMLEARGAKVAIDTMTGDSHFTITRAMAMRSAQGVLFLVPCESPRKSWFELDFAIDVGLDVAVAGTAEFSKNFAPCFDIDEEAITWLLDAPKRSAEETAS